MTPVVNTLLRSVSVRYNMMCVQFQMAHLFLSVCTPRSIFTVTTIVTSVKSSVLYCWKIRRVPWLQQGE